MHKKKVPRDIQDRLAIVDYQNFIYSRSSRRPRPFEVNVASLLRYMSLWLTLFCGFINTEMDGRCALLNILTHILWRALYLTAARFTLQSSKFAFLRQFSVPMSFARPNLVSVRPPSSSLQPSSKLSLSLARPRSSSCATLASWPTRLKMSTLASASTCLM
jgi:hypothetical protein